MSTALTCASAMAFGDNAAPVPWLLFTPWGARAGQFFAPPQPNQLSGFSVATKVAVSPDTTNYEPVLELNPWAARASSSVASAEAVPFSIRLSPWAAGAASNFSLSTITVPSGFQQPVSYRFNMGFHPFGIHALHDTNPPSLSVFSFSTVSGDLGRNPMPIAASSSASFATGQANMNINPMLLAATSEFEFDDSNYLALDPWKSFVDPAQPASSLSFDDGGLPAEVAGRLALASGTGMVFADSATLGGKLHLTCASGMAFVPPGSPYLSLAKFGLADAGAVSFGTAPSHFLLMPFTLKEASAMTFSDNVQLLVVVGKAVDAGSFLVFEASGYSTDGTLEGIADRWRKVVTNDQTTMQWSLPVVPAWLD